MIQLVHARGSLICFGLLLALFVLLITQNVSSEPYVYDEADYMYAASMGFSANWTDTPSIPIADFVQAGLGRGGRKGLSERIRGGNDVLFYRHFHGPLFHYLLIPLSRLGLSERAVRTSLLGIPCASLAVIYFGCLWLLPQSVAIVPAMLFLASYSVLGSTELAPHQLFALCSLASLILLLKAVATGRRRLLVWRSGGGRTGILHARNRLRAAGDPGNMLLRGTGPLARGRPIHGDVACVCFLPRYLRFGPPRFCGCLSLSRMR